MSCTLYTLSTQILANNSSPMLCGFSWNVIMHTICPGEPHNYEKLHVNWSSVVILGKYSHRFPLHSVSRWKAVKCSAPPWGIMSHTWMPVYKLHWALPVHADGWLKNLCAFWKLNKQVNTVSWWFFNLATFSHWQARLKCGPLPVICEGSTPGLGGFIRNTAP